MSTEKTVIRVTVWSEFRHEKKNPKVAAIYPDGMHQTIAGALGKHAGFTVRTATLDEPEHGLTDAVLDQTDVLVHSGHDSKIFKSLMGDTCSLVWREATDKERLWVTCPSHPIVQGLGPYIELAAEEMYGEPFGIPTPDELIFISWFTGGEVFRSGATWRRGNGRIFYFRPGHETYPTYHNPQIQQVIANAVRWAHTPLRIKDSCNNMPPLEPLPADSEAEDRPTIGFL